MKNIITLSFSDAELEQLRAYVNQAELDGWYYGTQTHFRKRHETIKSALGITDDSTKEQ